MADHYSSCLLGVMDRLWFHQIILSSSSESSTLRGPKTLKQQIPLLTGSLIDLPSTLSFSTLQEEEISLDYPPITVEEKGVDVNEKERRTRSNVANSGARSNPSSPNTANRGPVNTRTSSSIRKLHKSISCRSLGDLELEEVKGFMDLGFIFKKEHISPRMISLVPGLLRLGLYTSKRKTTKVTNTNELPAGDYNDGDDAAGEEQEEERDISRPYLSEAWLIRRPDSPLLNLKLPRVYAAAEMKKHLKFWARTVASVIQQES